MRVSSTRPPATAIIPSAASIGQLFRFRKTLGQDSEEEAGAAPDIEYPSRVAVQRESQVGRTHGDLGCIRPRHPCS